MLPPLLQVVEVVLALAAGAGDTEPPQSIDFTDVIVEYFVEFRVVSS